MHICIFTNAKQKGKTLTWSVHSSYVILLLIWQKTNLGNGQCIGHINNEMHNKSYNGY